MTATEERAALMEIAQKIQNELTLLRQEFIVITRPVSAVVARLVEAGDSLLLASATEIEKGEVKKVLKVRTSVSGEIEILGGVGKGTSTLAGPISPEQVVSIPRMVLGPGKRACGLCRQPGHRRQNCPNAHVVREKDIAAKAAPKGKKKRKPLTPEQRAVKVEILKKARAARKKGK